MLKICTRWSILCLGICLFVFFAFPHISTAVTILDFKVPERFTFSKDISSGSTVKPDISYLQNILNMSTSTTVAMSGPGSIKNHSNYFGVKTQDALGRFQTLFASDIELARSVSTSSATSTTVISSSTVDVFTRAVLNKLILAYSEQKKTYIEKLLASMNTGSVIAPTEASVVAPAGGFSGANLQDGSGRSNGNAAVIIAATAAAVGVVAASAAAEGAKQAIAPLNFGGQSVAMVVCACSANILLYVRDVRFQMLPLIYQPGVTFLYQGYQPRVGVHMLGNYVPGGVCLVYAGTGCVPGGVAIGTMTQLGTSLTIAPGL